MSELNPQKKKVVVLAATVACMSGGPILLKGHPRLLMMWIGCMVIALVLTLVEFYKLKGQGQ